MNQRLMLPQDLRLKPRFMRGCPLIGAAADVIQDPKRALDYGGGAHFEGTDEAHAIALALLTSFVHVCVNNVRIPFVADHPQGEYRHI